MGKSRHFASARWLALGLGFCSSAAWPAGIPTLDVVEVRAGAENLFGTASAATEGTATSEQLATRPLLRPAETLEIVPGVIVTQHSGDGKANQYFLRGFNLDHGTDFFTTVNGVPVNFPTHAHGQGYSDLNFLIPELVERVRYKKGPYSVEEGDFAAAGAAHVEYFRRLPANFAEIGVGQNGFRRGLVAGSRQFGTGSLLYGLEWQENDGPWTVPENYGRVNAVLRYSQGVWDNGWALTAMAYRGQWTATDQVARRAQDSGLLDRYGSLDASSGGKTQRYGLSGEWARRDAAGFSRANAYLIDYRLNLFSNFTYFLSDPINGDQFEQADRRSVFGAAGARTWYGKLAGRDTENTVGIALRRDHIKPVGLYLTTQRQRLTTIREDHVTQSSVGLYLQNQTQWAEKFRTVAGWRHDFYRFDVVSDRVENSGKRNDNIGGPKLALILGPWAETEFYANYGRGFHSNDARGATIRVNPDPRGTGFLGPVDPVSPLVRAKGYEVGLRSAPLPGLQTTLALWRLDLNSELLFVGDAGTTEAGRPSKRIGVEWANFYRPLDWLTMDADASLSRPRFRDDDPAGNRIPGAIERVISVGIGVDGLGPWFGGIRLRHVGPRPLTEDNSVRSASSTTVNVRAGYRLQRAWQVTVDVLNLFDRKVSDIDYFYASCLRQEVAGAGVVVECDAGAPNRPGVPDIHRHPAEPRTVRLSLRAAF